MRFFLFIIITLLSVSSTAQELDSFACKIIRVFNEKDSSEFLKLVLRPEDNHYIMGKKMGIVMEIENKMEDSIIKDFDRKISQSFVELFNLSASKGIQWGSVACDSRKFEKEVMDDSGIKVGRGNLIFKSGNKSFKLVLEGLILIRTNWRITKIDFELVE